MKNDVIFVRNLAIRAVAGVDAWHRPIAQRFGLDLIIKAGTTVQDVGLTDDLTKSLNYDAIAQQVRSAVESRQFKDTSELAALALQQVCMQCYPQHQVEIIATQPKMPLRAEATQVVVDSAAPTEHTLKICGLQFSTLVGINALERVHKQDVVVDAAFRLRAAHDPAGLAQTILDFGEKARWGTLESFANALADCLIEVHDLDHVHVTLRKPAAITLADAAGVSTERTRPNHTSEPKKKYPSVEPTPSAPDSAVIDEVTAYIAFGTNQGDRVANIRQSVNELTTRGVVVEESSQIYESEPAFHVDQPRFLNGVFRCRTKLSPPELLKTVKEVEYDVFNRVKLFQNGPRTLDLDILFWGNATWKTPDLTVPHIGIREREFVLRPLADVCSLHPVTGEPVSALLSALPGESTVVPATVLPSGQVIRRDHTAMMAVLNATPDSFSDGGTVTLDNVEELARAHVAAGAEVLDIGGMSTRPGSKPCSLDEELARVVPVIERLKPLGVPLSVDTWRSQVAKAAVEAGADIVNDVFAGAMDPEIWKVVAETGASYIAGHARGTQETMASHAEYGGNVLDAVASELASFIRRAKEAGVANWQIVLDPGLGFAKDAEADLDIIQHLDALRSHSALQTIAPNAAWLVGPSRKRFVGRYSNQPEAACRAPGTAAVATALAAQKCDFVRVHDTNELGQALRMANAIYRKPKKYF